MSFPYFTNNRQKRDKPLDLPVSKGVDPEDLENAKSSLNRWLREK